MHLSILSGAIENWRRKSALLITRIIKGFRNRYVTNHIPFKNNNNRANYKHTWCSNILYICVHIYVSSHAIWNKCVFCFVCTSVQMTNETVFHDMQVHVIFISSFNILDNRYLTNMKLSRQNICQDLRFSVLCLMLNAIRVIVPSEQ